MVKWILNILYTRKGKGKYGRRIAPAIQNINMSVKVLIISDMAMRENHGADYFRCLEKYGCRIEVVQDMVGWSDDQQSEAFLAMEKGGPDALEDNENVVKAMEDADIVISAFSCIPSRGIRGAKHLKAVCIMRSGVENINLKTANECGVKVINAPGRLAVPVSEFTVGLILAEVKNIARAHSKVMNGNFSDMDYVNKDYWFNLKGKRIGLVGCGAVGSRVARIMKAFEAEVLVYDPYVPEEKLKEQGYVPMELNELCSKADIISIHFRLTPETEGLIGKDQFNLMKPTCYLVNTARAGLVDEQALLDALRNYKIGGAALDVFHSEPLPENYPLLEMNNVTITPHLAGYCSDIFEITTGITLDALEHYFQTGEWKNTVN